MPDAVGREVKGTMRFTISVDNAIVVCHLHGDLVADSTDALMEQAKTLTLLNRHLVLDLTDVGFMDSSGLRACMQVHALLQEKGGLAAFVCTNENVARVFSMTKADQKLAMPHPGPPRSKN
jgi:anti-sigma B factor antagonist